MQPNNIDAIVLFSGPGGVSTGLQQIGNAVPPLLMTALVGSMCVSEIAPIETAVTA